MMMMMKYVLNILSHNYRVIYGENVRQKTF